MKDEIYRLVDKYGLPTALVIIALLIFMGLLPSPLAELMKVVPPMDKKIDAVLEQQTSSQKIFKSICLNTSRNDEQRLRCLE